MFLIDDVAVVFVVVMMTKIMMINRVVILIITDELNLCKFHDLIEIYEYYYTIYILNS